MWRIKLAILRPRVGASSLIVTGLLEGALSSTFPMWTVKDPFSTQGSPTNIAPSCPIKHSKIPNKACNKPIDWPLCLVPPRRIRQNRAQQVWGRTMSEGHGLMLEFPKLLSISTPLGGTELKWGSDRNLQNQTAMATKWQHVPSWMAFFQGQCHNSSPGCGKLAVWRNVHHLRCEKTVFMDSLEVVPVLWRCGKSTGAQHGAQHGARAGFYLGCQHVLLTLGQCLRKRPGSEQTHGIAQRTRGGGGPSPSVTLDWKWL